MRTMRISLLACLLPLLAPLAGAGERGAEKLPAPLALYASTAAPDKLLDSFDVLLSGLVKSGGMDDLRKALAGARAFSAMVDLDAIFPGPDAGIEIAAVFTPHFTPEVAFALNGVDVDALVAAANKGGVGIDFDGGVAELNFRVGPFGGDAVLTDLGGGRLLLAPDAETAGRFAAVLGEWRPEHPEGVDLRAVFELSRLKVMAAGELYSGEALDRLLRAAGEFPELEREYERESFRQRAQKLFERYRDLAMEPERLELRLDTNAAALRVSLSLAGNEGGLIADFAERYAGAEKRDYSLLNAIGENFLFCAASTGAHGTLLPDGPFFPVLMADAASLFFPAAVDAASLALYACAANPPEEHVSGFSLRDGAFRAVNHLRVADAEEFLSGLMAGVDALDVMGRTVARNRGDAPAHLSVGEGAYGFCKFRRVGFGTPGGESGPRRPFPVYAPGKAGFPGVYLAANDSVVTTLAGDAVGAAILAEEILAVEFGADAPVVGNDKAMALMNGLERREIAQSVFKPAELICLLFPAYARYHVANEAFADFLLEHFGARDKLAAAGFGAAGGMVTAELLLPYETAGCLFRMGAAFGEGDFQRGGRLEGQARSLREMRLLERRQRFEEALAAGKLEAGWQEDE